MLLMVSCRLGTGNSGVLSHLEDPPPDCPVVRALSREPERPQQNKPIPSTGKPLGQQKLERYLDRLSA